MKTSKYLISLITTYLVLSFFGTLSAEISAADKRMNELIEKYTPVYDASSISATQISQEDPFYDPDSYSSTSVVARVGVKLEDSVNASPKPGSSPMKSFIGYGDKQSYLQLYIKPMTLTNIVWSSDDRAFGDKIPLVPGNHDVEAKDEVLGKMRISLSVSSINFNIKVASSGRLYNSYENAPIYEVQITKVERR